jgi:transglutaminase-like putative cysteine protease
MFPPKRLSLLILLTALPALAAPPAATTAFDRWYQVFLGAEQVGSMHTTTRGREGVVESVTAMNLSMRRGDAAVNIAITTTFEETPDGKPIRARSSQTLGAMALNTEMIFGPESIEVVSRQGGNDRRTTIATTAADRDWLPPAAAERYVHERLAAGDKEIKWWTLDPAAGAKRYEAKLSVRGKEEVEVMGRRVAALSVVQTASNMPGVALAASADDFGRPIKSTMPIMGGLSITIVQATEADARHAGGSAEVLAPSLVSPDRPIPNPRRLKTAVYQLTLKSPVEDAPAGATHGAQAPPASQAGSGLDLPRGGFQRVVWDDDHTATVVVDLAAPVNPVDDLPTDDHRKATAFLDFHDAKVKALIARALAGQPADLASSKKAELIRRFVHHYVSTKDLSVGFATATEVAQTAEGDCTEHAVLLAAMLRGAGIPSRVVTGLIYVEAFAGRENVFGYHMWAQAWVPAEKGGTSPAASGGWVDLDAILGDDTPFDAAHIAVARSVLSDKDGLMDMGRLARMTGRLSIKVVEAGTENR